MRCANAPSDRGKLVERPALALIDGAGVTVAEFVETGFPGVKGDALWLAAVQDHGHGAAVDALHGAGHAVHDP